MKLTDHTWGIFGIAKANNTDVDNGLNMHVANMAALETVYPGNSYDYATLGAEWATMSRDAQQEQYQLTRSLILDRFGELTKARRENDRKAFDTIVEQYAAEMGA
ncbi:MAG: hypothetical protein LIO58_02360 [Oscillospiraceae bacterium]|nr:hypothetical protein [Oscillospiraceae bacterium]